ncbi:MAG: ferrous iron transport protein B [Candidatus Methanomethylophilaceae archaeon]|nr:ferrous iron transport protein B [Candidatus Methanomethylophilaceae archaeon]
MNQEGLIGNGAVGRSPLTLSLVGQPNVGKSSLFSRLTGVGVISSNYPGTTVQFEESVVRRGERTLNIKDVPGTYSLSGESKDEAIVVEMLASEENDMIVVVADASNLEPSLVLCLEVLELGVPTIVALNKFDVAKKRFEIDTAALEKMLSVPVIPVSAKSGEGIEELMEAITSGSAKISDYRVRYDRHIVEYLAILQGYVPEGPGARGRAVKLLEGIGQFYESIPDSTEIIVSRMRREFEEEHGEPLSVHMARDRYGDARVIVMGSVRAVERKLSAAERISEITVNPSTGIPILIGVFGLIFMIMIFGGSFLDGLVSDFYDTYIGAALPEFGRNTGGQAGEIIMTGLDNSLRAVLGLVIPYILVFYIILGVLEDTGYLPRVVVLLDRVTHRFGMHGNAFIPMVVGLGCNVPAIMATRSLLSKRERVIVCTLIAMAIPCSAQMAIIMGVTGVFAGAVYAFMILGVLFFLALIVAALLNKFLPHEPSNLSMELPEMTSPNLQNVLRKAWSRIKDFFVIAVPLLLIGSIIMETLLAYNLLDPIVEPFSFVTVTMLGLPAVTVIAFLVGILRKEMAYGMLLILAAGMPITEFMTPSQFVVFGLVMAIYLPCVATMAAMWREIGWKETLVVSAASVALAVAVGTLFNMLL